MTFSTEPIWHCLACGLHTGSGPSNDNSWQNSPSTTVGGRSQERITHTHSDKQTALVSQFWLMAAAQAGFWGLSQPPHSSVGGTRSQGSWSQGLGTSEVRSAWVRGSFANWQRGQPTPRVTKCALYSLWASDGGHHPILAVQEESTFCCDQRRISV